ncbi:glycoside hydrolase family 18 protein [Botrytis cinerea T4]|uniref:chitinase n=1 Tax=Botryotinia fuckeliana (strain T4) TaxID=999810 RepID=G2YY20_BOTF4|nr:glycoside hydrolase family 18 protein [Botrytis cinerea T4]
MYPSKSFTVAAATFALIAPAAALYDASSPANLALYWGSGPSQTNLSYYCEQSTVDIIPLAFMNVFPAQGDGYPAENFGNACYGQPIFTPGPGYPLGDVNTSKDQLYVQCPGIQEGIPYCQSLGKKILLSLGGASNTYQLTGAADGEYFADFLWGSYGPFKQSWLDAGGIRPMDGGYYGTDSSVHIDIDGFDFDIEFGPTDYSEGYIAMINRLREHFAENPSKKYFISGAPQCPLPEPNMGAMIAGAQFDLLWIQFYNNAAAQCTARQWADNYALTGQEDSAEFTYDQWLSTINNGASAGASIYLGLLGSTLAGTASDYISPLEAQSLIESYHNKPQFGGVMIWEATYSQENTDEELKGDSYHGFIKSCLASYAPPPPTSTSSIVHSTTISSSSSTSEVSITSSVPASTESSAATSSTVISISSTSTSVSESSSTSTLTSSESSTTSSSSLLETSTTSTSTSTSVSETSTVTSSSSLESSAAQSSTYSEVLPTQASSGYTIPGYSHNATSSLTHSQVHSSKPAGSYTFTGHSSKPTSIATGYTSKSHSAKPSSKPSSGYTSVYSSNSTTSGSVHSSRPYSTKSVVTGTGVSSKPYHTKSSVIGTGASTKPYPTKSSIVGTGQSSKPRPTKSLGTGVKSCKSRSKTRTRTKTKTKTSSAGPSGYPASTSSVVISSTAPYGNSTYSHSETTPASSATSSVEGITVSSGTATETGPGSSATDSTVVGPSTSGTSELPTGSATNSGSVTSETGSASASGSISSGTGSITSAIQYTTSTAYVTTVYTITSCAATITDCPGRIGSVTTETISSYTTVCPVTATATSTSSAEGISVSSKPSSAPGVTASQTPSSSAQGSATLPITSVVQYTTSTAYVTSVYTITSCAATVTDCPGRIGSVTTETISSYTTVCPVTETSGNSGIVSSTSSPAGGPVPTTTVTSYGTSTVYQTSVYTITSCAPSVTDCPARSGQVTTETISSYTSVYPITVSTAPINVPTSGASSAAGIETSVPGVKVSSTASIFTSAPAAGASSIAGVSSAVPTKGASSAAGIVTSVPVIGASSSAATPEAASPTSLYTTLISTLINSQTTTISAIVAPSIITVVPVAIASPSPASSPYTSIAPPYGAGNGTLVATGTASSITRVPKPSSYVVKAEGESTSAKSGSVTTQTPVATPSAVTFEGGAEKLVKGLGVWAAVGMMGLVLFI